MNRLPQRATDLRGRPSRKRDIRNVAIALLVTGTLGYLAFPADEHSRGPGKRAQTQQTGAARLSPSSSSVQAVQAAPPISLRDLTWQDYQGIRLPSSVKDGPLTSR